MLITAAIVQYLKGLGLKPNDLAKRLHGQVSEGTVYRFWEGKPIRTNTLQAIIAACEIRLTVRVPNGSMYLQYFVKGNNLADPVLPESLTVEVKPATKKQQTSSHQYEAVDLRKRWQMFGKRKQNRHMLISRPLKLPDYRMDKIGMLSQLSAVEMVTAKSGRQNSLFSPG